jgi:hypothetical protein
MPSRKYTNEQIKSMDFGYLIPIQVFTPNNRKAWKCRCICGSIVERTERNLVAIKERGFKQSCGCKSLCKSQTGNKAPIWKGIGELGGQYIASIRCRAKKNGLEYNLTSEFLWKLFLKQDRRCSLTKLPIQFATRREQLAGKELTASLDRIDSNKGYTQDNVQWVHKDPQRMKNAYSQDRFIEICKLVAQHN